MTAYSTSNHLKLMSRNAPTYFPETHSSAWNREERSMMRREKQIRASRGRTDLIFVIFSPHIHIFSAQIFLHIDLEQKRHKL